MLQSAHAVFLLVRVGYVQNKESLIALDERLHGAASLPFKNLDGMLCPAVIFAV